MAAGSWSLLKELFAAGAAEFLAEIRHVHHGERLGEFAATWFADPRPIARQFLFDYLDQPLNCYRHEALVKRLFKLAEKAGDDEVMGAFLAAFDRSVRRRPVSRRLYREALFTSRVEAEEFQQRQRQQGIWVYPIEKRDRQFVAQYRELTELWLADPQSKMPRPAKAALKRDTGLSDAQRAKFEKRFLLFSLPTRRYLRRRAWRYFRKLGAKEPERYLRAAMKFLLRYRDDDIASEQHLLDNWGLMNALFHGCDALHFTAKGVAFAEGKTIADLRFAPRFEEVWKANGEALFTLMLEAKCRAVRRWAHDGLKLHHEAWLASFSATRLLMLVDCGDANVQDLGYQLLDAATDLETIPVDQWLRRLDSDDLDKLTRLSEFLKRRLDPARVSAEAAIQLAIHRSKPVAELGFATLRQQSWGNIEQLLPLANAESDGVRTEAVKWLIDRIAGEGSPTRSEFLLELFDSRFEDVRRAAWELLGTRIVDQGGILLLKLMESPYDDVRLALQDKFDDWQNKDPVSTRSLWASILTNIHRGGRQKPGVVAAIVERGTKHPAEAEALLPLLAIAVRSLRGPEFRAGLAGLVQLSNTTPEMRSRVQAQFPELALGG